MDKIIVISLLMLSIISACSNSSEEETEASRAKAPVSITNVSHGTISDSVALSATAFYFSNNRIVAPFSGYIVKAGLQPGDVVEKGQVLFELRTREASALQSDPDTSNSGLSGLGNIQIKAPSDGYLTTVDHVLDDYVQEGGNLANIVNPDNLYLKLFVPYEYHSAIEKGNSLRVELPSGGFINASVTGTLNQADPVSQSVVWLLKPDRSHMLPDGLNMTAHVSIASHNNAQLLPKDAVLADETLQSFWVMKVINDSLAVRVPVTKGIETEQQVEVLSPDFSPTDQIILSGQFGLEDSTLVQITNPGS